MTKKLGGQRKSPQRAAGVKEEHQCGGTGSHTGRRYVDMLTPPDAAQHRQSTGVCEAAIKPGDFTVMTKSVGLRSRWIETRRYLKAKRTKKKPAASCGRKGGTSMWRNRQSHRTSLRRHVNAARCSATPPKYGSLRGGDKTQ